MLKSCLTLTQIVLSDFEQQILKKVQNTSKMIRFSRDMYTNTMNKSFPVGIMKSKLIRCQWSGAAALRINAFLLAPLCAALLKMKQDSQRRLSGMPRSVQPSAVCPSNSSCPLPLQLHNPVFNSGGIFCVILRLRGVWCGIWGWWRCLNARLDVPEVCWGSGTSQEKKEMARYPSPSMTPILHN